MLAAVSSETELLLCAGDIYSSAESLDTRLAAPVMITVG